MNGYLKIKTRIDNKEVDKDISELENKIKKLQEDNATRSQEQSSLQDEIDSYNNLCQEADRYKQKIKELNIEKQKIFRENPSLAVAVDTPEYANIKSQIEDMKNKYANTTKEIDKQAPKIEKIYSKLDKVKSKQSENNAKITEYKQKLDQISTNKIQAGLNTVGKNLQKQIHSLGKMAMAVIGIRTAWNLVRGAINAVTQYNEQVATDFEYMRFCIANMLAPAVQWLIQLLYTVLSYVNAIMSAWFGINIFSNSSAKAFQKMQKSAGSTAKSAKEIQKSLQGFDEMNVLQDNSDSGGSTGSGSVAPSMDLSNLQGEVPEWLKWIIDNKDLILGALLGIAGGILAIKLGATLLQGLGIGLIFFGIYEIVQSISDLMNGDFVSGLTKYLIGLAAFAVGVGIIFGGIPALIVAIIGVVALVAITINRYGDEIKQKFDEFSNWLFGLIDRDWRELFGPFLGEILNNTVNIIKKLMDNAKNMLYGIVTFVEGVFSGDWKKAWEGLKQFFTGYWGSLLTVATMFFTQIGAIINRNDRTEQKIFSLVL